MSILPRRISVKAASLGPSPKAHQGFHSNAKLFSTYASPTNNSKLKDILHHIDTLIQRPLQGAIEMRHASFDTSDIIIGP